MSNIKYSFTILLLLIGNIINAQTSTISGLIYDSSRNTELCGANIYIENSTIGTSSNTQGKYIIKSIKSGTYNIIVSFSGYIPIKKSIKIKDGENILDFRLSKSNNKLDEIVVTGTGTNNSMKNTPVYTELFTKRQITDQNSRNFESLMTNLSPNLDFSPNKMGSRMTLNGLGNDYILVLIDGKRLHGDVGGLNDLNRINTQNIDRIELVKGSSSALYGSEAMAGVINIITKKNNHDIYLENATRIGSYGDFQQYNDISLKFGKLKSTTKFTRKQSNGWQVSKKEWVRDRKHRGKKKLADTHAKTVKEHTDFEISQKLDYKINKKTNIYAEASVYQKDVKQDIRYKAYGYFYDNKSVLFGSNYIINEDAKISLKTSYDKYKYFYKYSYKYITKHLNEQGVKALETHYEGDKSLNSVQERYNSQLNGVFKLNTWNKINTGLEYSFKKLESPHRITGNKADAYTMSAFAQDEINISENINLVTGIRYVNHKEFGSILTPKISMLVKANKLSFRANYSTGYKAPTLKQLYMNYESSGMGSHNLYIGNTNLKAEKSKYSSVVAQYNNKTFSASISAYNNDISDMIDYRIVKTSKEYADRGVVNTKEHYNIYKARTRGIDLSVDTQILKSLSLSTSYSYLDARDVTENINLDGTSHHYANINCMWHHDWQKYMLKINISGRLQSKKFYKKGIKTVDELISGNTKEYNIWNINSTHIFSRYKKYAFEASMGVNNIFDFTDDSPYGQNHSTLSPGRTFTLGLNIKFIK